MDNYLLNPVNFLVTTIFDLYIVIVLLRFLLQLFKADFYNPISQFIVKVTSPPLKPLRRIIPGLWGVDISSLVLLFILKITSVTLIILFSGQNPALSVLLFWSLADLVSLTLNLFLFAIIIQAVLSWITPPGNYNPVNGILYALTEPLLLPARRMIPPISGLDLSPIAVIIVLQVAQMLIVPPLKYLAVGG